ncbi:uncharacterized protein LOC111445193 [Cucurbita moschata]|uniref:Uncharacterized protein LOC111445193 n=1 Tax=Cucurbita moschata TaxID=3662 RepID=A0A6J1FG69_CUCMO|nr:uncharacterized protein LOC111445193 [Cucurbita moschata]XP_022939217.1 uncharacterized protein LOC111445193 [Cucurbita moschata]
METPSSIRRVTRSQTLAAANSASNSNISISRKIEECDNNGLSKSLPRNRKSQDLAGSKVQDRSALIDITNDSPIVGLAAGNMMTPISSVAAKQRSCRPKMMTPGSGEALLRGQVKTLLQRVEEEAEISKLTLERRPVVHLQSPMGLAAPTPANTPQVLNLSQDGNLSSTANVSIAEEHLISQVVDDIDLSDEKKQDESQITRSLLLDFSEKSEIIDDDEAASSVCSSVFTPEEKSSPSRDDDNSSIWSIQVNASSHGEDDDEEEGEEELIEDEEEEDVEGEDDGLLDELCRGLSKISVDEKGKAEEFVGKHTRFVYDSEDELIEQVCEGVSPNVIHLKGMPTPKGKHLRFSTEDEEVEEPSQ